jgi:hypothetical protein
LKIAGTCVFELDSWLLAPLPVSNAKFVLMETPKIDFFDGNMQLEQLAQEDARLMFFDLAKRKFGELFRRIMISRVFPNHGDQISEWQEEYIQLFSSTNQKRFHLDIWHKPSFLPVRRLYKAFMNAHNFKTGNCVSSQLADCVI